MIICQWISYRCGRCIWNVTRSIHYVIARIASSHVHVVTKSAVSVYWLNLPAKQTNKWTENDWKMKTKILNDHMTITVVATSRYHKSITVELCEYFIFVSHSNTTDRRRLRSIFNAIDTVGYVVNGDLIFKIYCDNDDDDERWWWCRLLLLLLSFIGLIYYWQWTEWSHCLHSPRYIRVKNYSFFTHTHTHHPMSNTFDKYY